VTVETWGAQTTLSKFEPDLDVLSDAERDVWEAVEQGDTGAREYARENDLSPGTVSNLLRRARDKLDDER